MRYLIRKLSWTVISISLFPVHSFSQIEYAGPDTAIVKGNRIMIGTSPYSETWCYTWEPNDSLSDRKAPQPEAHPTVTTNYSVTVVGPDFKFTEFDEMTLKVLDPKVEFKEYPNQNFGFDNYGENSAIPWKSVVVGESDSVLVNITPAEDHNHIFFKSTNTSNVSISPGKADSGSQGVVVTGNAYGTSDLQANGDEENGININKMKVQAYNKRSLTVAIILIAEVNDDNQLIPVGEGSPYETAITAGNNNILNSTKGGDDEIAGNTINTGFNGICESKALFDDNQVIGVDSGLAYSDCIDKGLNHDWDTKYAIGDDQWAGDVINTGADGICNTKAKDSTIVSTDTYDLSLGGYLNKVYGQAGIEWTVYRLPECHCNYDINKDDSLDTKINDGVDWMTAEMKIIAKSCGDTTYYRNIFLVDRSTAGTLGEMKQNQRYGFIHADEANVYPYDPLNVIAHELGHSLGLNHTYELKEDPLPSTEVQDPENLMHPLYSGWKLRKNQWDIINPKDPGNQ